MINSKLLGIYLNDHLAGSTAGRDLARRAASQNAGNEYGAALERIAREVDEDRDALIEIMRSLEIGHDKVKLVAGWSAEKLGRLKLNGSLLSYSPLSRVVELEGLKLGVGGKLSLWQALEQLVAEEPRLDAVQLAGLAARAERQFSELEDLRLRAAREALSV